VLRAATELVIAANGLRPLARQGYITLPVFAFGWPTTELPIPLMLASMLDALRRARRGDFAAPGGKVALGLTAAVWAALAVIHRRGVRSGAVLAAALADGLGPDYPQALASPAATPRGRPISRPLSTGWARHRYVTKKGTISYGPHNWANLADVWRRHDLPRDGKAPVIVQIPGGAWVLGWNRGQAYPLLAHLADRGWVCVSINYRVSPAHTWPDHIVDVKRALAWVKDNIAAFGGDPDFVAVTGGSAGGHLATLAALTPNDPAFQPGFEDADTSVVAAVPVYGRYDWVSTDGSGRPEFIAFLQRFVVKKSFGENRRIYVDASPIERLTPQAPPFFVLHGQDDSLIPVGEARAFVAALKQVSRAPLVYAELPGAQHAFDVFGSPRAYHTAEAVEKFLSWVYATRQYG
jgi:acetyl esterase/lipase